MSSSSRPIGVFDSGIGGLTVAREIIARLPRESIVYYGDTARVPYGPKSPDTVRRYSREIAGFLRAQDVKALVMACNTATAHALEVLREEHDIPVLGVIEPGARAAVRVAAGSEGSSGHIGVIGTSGTIASGAYERAIREIDPDARVSSRACPLLVPLIEEGWIDHPATRLIIHEYIQPLLRDDIDVLVLGCTHYPLLRNQLCREIGAGAVLIDSAAETATELARVLRENGIEAGDESPRHRFVASDDPLQFLQLGQRFLGDSIDRVEIHTFA
jgi:glutamate racemase